MKKNLVKRICIFLIVLGFILIPVSLSRYKTTYSSTVHLNVIKPVFTVIFNANGGTGVMTDQEILIDTDTDLKPNEYTRQDYLFTGWNTQDDGGGTDYADEASVRNLAAQGSSITLYAQWEEIQGVAEINGRYYDTIAEAITACPGTSNNPATTPTTIRILRDVEESSVIKKGQNIIINLDGHTVSNVGDTSVIENNGTLVVTNGTLTKEPTSQHAVINNFTGGVIEIIDVSVIGTGSKKAQALYNESGTATIKGNSYLSAESQAGNDGRSTVVNAVKSGVQPTLIIEEGTIVAPNQSAVKNNSGTVIIGKQGAPANNTSPMLQGKIYGLDNSGGTAYFYDGICKGETKGINKTIPADRIETGCSIVTGTDGNYKTAYLQPSNTIRFKYNDGTTNEEIMYRNTGATLGTLPEPTSEGYAFDGWYTAADGGTQITSSTTVSGDATYFAHWIHKKLVEFDANGGSVSEESRYVLNGDEVGELPVPEYYDHRFDGWFTERIGGTQVTSSTTITSDIEFYAHWTEIYTVLFDPNGGKLANASDREKDVEHGAQIGSLPTPTRTNSTFLGWFTERTGGTQVTASTAITADTTLYAHWSGPEVVSIDGVTYPTLQDAIDAVPTDGTLTTIAFLTDVSTNVTTAAGQNIELDLGNYTLSNHAKNNPVIFNYGALKITNGTITSNGDFATINNYDTLIVTGGNIIATGTRQAIYNDAGHVEISGSAYLSSGNIATDKQRGTVHNLNGGTMLITGGTIVAEKESAVRNEGGTITIGTNDGTISTSSPVIRGTKYGLNNSSTIYFYDGVVRVPTGKTLITGTIPSTPNGYAIAESTETIDGVTYKTAYLSNAIAIPTANTGLVYDGTQQIGVPSNDGVYTITGNTATEAGTHTATASLKYPSTSTWSDGTTADKTITYTIDRATVTPEATADNKAYDGTTAGTGTISLTGVISGDTVTASATSFTFASPEVGTGITVTASGITISGTDAANYQLSTTTVETTADITGEQNNAQSLPNAQITNMGPENNTKMINTTNSNDIQGAQLKIDEAITDEENQTNATNLDETSITSENKTIDDEKEDDNTEETTIPETTSATEETKEQEITDVAIPETEETKDQKTTDIEILETKETKDQETLGTAIPETEETKEQETPDTTMQETEETEEQETLETTMQETEETKETTTP